MFVLTDVDQMHCKGIMSYQTKCTQKKIKIPFKNYIYFLFTFICMSGFACIYVCASWHPQSSEEGV